MRGTSRGQQEILEKQGWIPACHAAKLMGVHHVTIYRWIDAGKIEGIRIGHLRYVRKTAIAIWLRDNNPNYAPDYLPWLFLEEKSGECKICALKIPISKTYCVDCVTVDLRDD